MFQRKIATGRFTLAWAVVIALLAWTFHASLTTLSIPLWGSMGGGLLASFLAIWLMAELNNQFALLRIRSRMLSTLLMLLLAASPMLHDLSFSHLVLIAAILAYFNLFATYQRPQATTHTFLIYFLLAVASIVFPQLLMLVPVWWVAQLMLRSLSFRSWIASLLGLVTPYWLVLTAAYCTDRLPLLRDQLTTGWTPAATSLSLLQLGESLAVGILFLIGTIDFLLRKHLDKTRTRNFFYVAILIGIASFALLAFYPQHFDNIFPLVLIGTAMLGGHFAALSYGRLQNILVITFFILLLAAAFVLPLLSALRVPIA